MPEYGSAGETDQPFMKPKPGIPAWQHHAPNAISSDRMRSIVKSQVTAARLFLALLAAAGCAVGPDFKRPAAPPVKGYTGLPLKSTPGTPNVAGGEAQRFVEGLEIPGQWWALFHSKPLNDLIERSLTNNPDLKAAQAALVVAQENVLAQRGAYYPSIAGIILRQPPEAVRVFSRPRPMPMYFNTICSPRKSAFRTCPMFLA